MTIAAIFSFRAITELSECLTDGSTRIDADVCIATVLVGAFIPEEMYAMRRALRRRFMRAIAQISVRAFA